MKKYFKAEDFIVFAVAIVCFIWIITYKTILIDTKSLFYNADRWADITYTIFSSVVAAGIFYFITLYLPRYRKTKEMIDYLTSYYLNNIDNLQSKITSEITEVKTGIEYESFNLFDSQNKEYENDFISYYNNSVNSFYLNGIIGMEKGLIVNMINNFSLVLPNKILTKMIDFTTGDFSFITYNTKIFFATDLHFSAVKKVQEINIELKDYYDLK